MTPTSASPVGDIIVWFIEQLRASDAMSSGVQFDVAPITNPNMPEVFVLRSVDQTGDIIEVGAVDGEYDPEQLVPTEETARVTFDYWSMRANSESFDQMLRGFEVVGCVQRTAAADPTANGLADIFSLTTYSYTPGRAEKGVVSHGEFVLSVTTSLR